MRSALLTVALLVSTTPVAAQKPTAALGDAIRRAAIADTAERIAGYHIAGDTAWATIVDPRTPPGAAREVRLERRAASWARVSSRPVVIAPPARDTAPKPYKLAPPPPRP
jgi:hypothetical protein